MTNDNKQKQKDIYIKRNREIIEKIKRSEDDAEKKIWIIIFVWCNLKYFFTNIMRIAIVDYENDQKAIDHGDKKGKFNHGSAARWLRKCDSAEEARKKFEAYYPSNSADNTDSADRKSPEDNSFYYLRKICIDNLGEISKIDMDHIEDGDDYLKEICRTIKPLLEKSSTFYRPYNEDPGVMSGRIKADSIRRMEKRSHTVVTVPLDDALENKIPGQETFEVYGKIDFDVVANHLKHKYPELRILPEDDESVKNEKTKKFQEHFEFVKKIYKEKVVSPEDFIYSEEIVLQVIEEINSYDPEMYRILMHYWEKGARIDILNKSYEEFHNDHYEYKYMKPFDMAREMVKAENPNATEREIKEKEKIIRAKSRQGIQLINEISTSRKSTGLEQGFPDI